MKNPSAAQLDRLGQAQDIIYSAWEARTDKQAVALANKALALSPLCADAYVLLAMREKDDTKALELWRKGFGAGEAALGSDGFEEYAGEFWGFLETRPYMRARHGLAMCLWDLRSHEEAVAHARDMLRLNPNDNQGVRYVLAAWYAELAHDAELERLLREYKDDGSAFWLWTAALLAFRQGGDSKKSQKLMKKAAGDNPHVAAYLLGSKEVPKPLPQFYSPGDETEAICYVDEFAEAWRRTEGALQWLKRQCA